MSELRFDGRVAVVTGGARGLGREYALMLASRGAALVINDLGGNRSGEGSSSAADQVVQEIRDKGGKAVANYNSVEEGHKIVKTAIDTYGRIDILINNAGILRDKSFSKITEQDWDLVHAVHLKGSFLVTRAAWPYFREQNYGRIIMTSSPAGIYGNFGQTNYSSAKLGLVALSNTLAIEGSKYNIKCNTIAPVAASRLTEDIFPSNFNDYFKPSYVAPIVVLLSHESCPESGSLIEAAGGFVGKYRWQRSSGKVFPPNNLTPEAILDSWDQITNMNKWSSPLSIHEHSAQLSNSLRGSSDDTNNVEEVPSHRIIHNYTVDDCILYALSVGVSTRESNHLKFLYECSDQFCVIPSYGTVAGLKAVFESAIIQDALLEYNIKADLVKAIHGEQYLEQINPIPVSGALVSEPKVIDVLDKGSGALVIIGVDSYDENGTHLMYNQMSVFIIGAGNFGGKRKSDNSSIIPIVEPPNRSPDAIVYEKTSIDQAAIHRLCGDKNPLHIDPMFAAVGGFSSPILHGLCTMGYALRHVLREFADYDVLRFKSMKTRFVGPLIPGQTIQTNMWKENNRIHFQSFIQETGKPIISGAYVDLINANSNHNFNGYQSENLKLSENQTQNFNLQPNVPMNAYISDFHVENIQREDIPFLTNKRCDNDLHLSSNLSNEISYVCAPYQGSDGGSDDGNGGRIDRIFGGWLLQRIKENKELVPIIKTVYQWNITKSGKIISVWTLDLKNGDGDVYKGSPRTGKADCALTIDEDSAVNVFEGRDDAMKAFMSGKLKITGNILAAQKLQQLWAEEAPRGSVSLDEDSSDASFNNANDNLEDKALLESVPVSGLKCDIVFTVFKNRMHEEPDLVRRIKVIFQFNITIDGKHMTTWTADNKTTTEGNVYTGVPKNGKPDCIVTVEDDDFLKLMVGKLNPQRAFMMGKLKIKGNIMLLQKLNSLWLDLQKQGKAPELPFLTDMMLKTSVIPGLKSESMIVELVQRLVRLPQLCTEINTLIGFNITKDGNSVSKWTLDFTKNKTSGVFDRGLPDKKYCILTVDDNDFVRLTFNRINLQNAIANGKVKVEGDKSIPQKINILFTTPTTRAKL